MSDIRNTRLLIAAAIFGFVLAMYSTAHGQSIDAGPPDAAQTDAEVVANSGVETSVDPEKSAEASIPGVVDAVPVNPAEVDPTGTALDVYTSLKGGQYLIAFGGVLMFLVWGLRLLLMWLKVKWVSTKPGGFVLAFGTAFLLAIGTAWVAGEGVSLGLFSAAAVAAWAAAGKYGHFKDALDHLHSKKE